MSQTPLVSEPFGTVPNTAESFGTLPNSTEDFRTMPKSAERTDGHTLTVREVARMFEDAGVARTERSIINWCQLNKLGVARLDAYFDPNERRYFITGQSVELAIQEEQAKTAKQSGLTETSDSLRKDAEWHSDDSNSSLTRDKEEIEELKREIMNLTITDRVKDHAIKQYEKDRSQFAQERKEYIEQLMTCHRQIGTLETQLLQLNPSRSADEGELRVGE